MVKNLCKLNAMMLTSMAEAPPNLFKYCHYQPFCIILAA